MKAVRWYANNDTRLVDVDIPKVGPNDVLVKVNCTGICATDLHIHTSGLWIGERPVTIGHEFCGDVVEIGPNVTNNTEGTPIKVGDRVVGDACQVCGTCYWCKRGYYLFCDKLAFTGLAFDGSFAEYVKIPDHTVYKVPDNFTYEQGAMVEGAAVAVHATLKSNVSVGDTVVVIGGGSIGLLTMQACKAAGARVIMSELSEYRLNIAKDLGADEVINAGQEDPILKVRELTGGMGADIVIEAVGHPKSMDQGVQMARKGGSFTFIGIPTKRCDFNMDDIIFRELKFTGSLAYNYDFRRTINLIAAGKINVDKVVTHKLPLADFLTGIEMGLAAKESVKILLVP